MVEFLNNFAKRNGIIIGACHAEPLEKARGGISPFVPFVSGDTEKRTNPRAILSEAKSIIVVGAGHRRIHSGKKEGARLSSLGVNEDYHVYVKEILRNLVAELSARWNFKYKILVDSPFLDERALARRAGLGFMGRNGLIISRKFGSRFNIGCLLTNLPLPEDAEDAAVSDACPPGCGLCIEACPSNALREDGFHAEKCVSYLTQKERLDEEENLHNQLFGCDICQDACPFNEKEQAVFVDPNEWLAMTDDDFMEKYGRTAMMWRGTGILRRNAGQSIKFRSNLT